MKGNAFQTPRMTREELLEAVWEHIWPSIEAEWRSFDHNRPEGPHLQKQIEMHGRLILGREGSYTEYSIAVLYAAAARSLSLVSDDALDNDEPVDDMEVTVTAAVHNAAVSALMGRHAAEYKQLLRETAFKLEIDELQETLSNVEAHLRRARELNPDGVDVVALSETVATLAKENEELHRKTNGSVHDARW